MYEITYCCKRKEEQKGIKQKLSMHSLADMKNIVLRDNQNPNKRTRKPTENKAQRIEAVAISSLNCLK